jgi:hypothetical protein
MVTLGVEATVSQIHIGLPDYCYGSNAHAVLAHLGGVHIFLAYPI